MNPSELTLFVLRFGFLFIVWVFVFAVAYALRSDFFGQKVRKLPQNSVPLPRAAPIQAPAVALPGSPSGSRATRLVITSGPRAGLELVLGDEPVTIGRSSESGVVIRDEYTSTHHAQLTPRNDAWMLQDLDSTNGTFVNERRVSVPVQVEPGTPIRIGQTTFELRR